MRIRPGCAAFPSLLPWLLLALLVGGCAPTTPLPVDHFYRLPQAGPAVDAGRIFPGILAIGRVRATGLYNERPILFVDGAAPLEIQRHRYQLWQDTPATLIRDHLRAFLRAAGCADQVLFVAPGLRPDQVLDVRLTRFEQLLNADGSQVVVALAFTGRPASGRPWHREYSVTSEVAGEGMQATVAAFGEGLERIYTLLLRDVAGVSGGEAAGR